MSVLETALVFGVIPLGIVAMLALLVFVPSVARTPRYRPGRPWDYEPVWYVPHPLAETPAQVGAQQIGAGPEGQQPIPAKEVRPVSAGHAPASVLDAPVKTAKGGAHGSW